MQRLFHVFARRGNEEANRWLSEHPLVLGLILLGLGGAILAWGIHELVKGVAYDKYGKQLSGGGAKLLAIVRIVAGGGFAIFGLYKMIAG